MVDNDSLLSGSLDSSRLIWYFALQGEAAGMMRLPAGQVIRFDETGALHAPGSYLEYAFPLAAVTHPLVSEFPAYIVSPTENHFLEFFITLQGDSCQFKQ
jgi:hypothetical protein